MRLFSFLCALVVGCGARTSVDERGRRSCPSGFADCDGNRATICETEIDAENAHCGACGSKCSNGLSCARGACRSPRDFVQVVAGSTTGGDTTCARRVDGLVYCWGANESNQLGDGTIRPSHVPKEVAGVSALELSTARFWGGYTCARTPLDEMVCWGLQPGTTPARERPKAVAAPPSLAHIAVSDHAMCALTRDGRTYCEGAICGAAPGAKEATCWAKTLLAIERTRDRGSIPAEPLQLSLPLAVELDVGATVTADGDLYCWGSCAGTDGEQLDSNGVDVLSRNVIHADVGVYCRVFATDVAGRVRCWQPTVDGRPIIAGPRPDPNHTRDVVQVAIGGYHICLRLRSGDVECWGNNVGPPNSSHGRRVGVLGTGSPDADVASPARVAGLHDVVDIAAGDSHTCAVRSNGEVWCWGSNFWGQLGDGTTESRATPVRVVGL